MFLVSAGKQSKYLFLLSLVKNYVFDYYEANPYLQNPELWFLSCPMCDHVLICEELWGPSAENMGVTVKSHTM